MREIKAWIEKYIFKIKSPSCLFLGYEYEWDMLRERSKDER